MSRVKTLLMAILAVILLILFYQEKNQSAGPSPEEVEEELVLGNIKSEQIKELHLIAKENSYHLKRVGNENKWVLRKPENVPADTEKVTRIIGILMQVKAKNILLDNEIEQDQSVYGLVPPEMVLNLTGDFGVRTLSFGKHVQASGRRYVQRQDDRRLFLVEENVFNLLNISVDQVFDKVVFALKSKEVKEFSVIKEDKKYLVFNKDSKDNAWQVKDGEKNIKADANLINKKLEQLNKIKAKHVLEITGDNMALFGIKTPVAYLNFIYNDEDEYKFLIGESVSLDILNLEELNDENKRAEKAYYLKLPEKEYVYHLPYVYFKDFLQGIDFFREREPFKNLTTPSKLTLTKDQKKEIVLNPEQQEKISQWLKGFYVISYQALSEEEKTKAGLVQAKEKIELYFDNDQNKSIILNIGNKLSSRAEKVVENTPFWLEIKFADGAIVTAITSYDMSILQNFMSVN